MALLNYEVEEVTTQFLKRTLTGILQSREQEAMKNESEENFPQSTERMAIFFSASKPKIRTSDYVERLVQYAGCSNSAFVVAMVYLKRLARGNRMLKISSYNLHRLLIIALVLAVKMLDDRCYRNSHYARIGGISKVLEMNMLEREMLMRLEFRLIVDLDEYKRQIQDMHSYLPPEAPSPPLLVIKNLSVETDADCDSGVGLFMRSAARPHFSREVIVAGNPWCNVLNAIQFCEVGCFLAQS